MSSRLKNGSLLMSPFTPFHYSLEKDKELAERGPGDVLFENPTL